MNTTAQILLTIFNSFIYMTICFLIIRNQKFSSLSIRSPILLNMNIIFLFLTQTSLLFKLFENLFYFCQIPIFLSFFIRFLRIYFCVKTPSLTTSKQHFQAKADYYTQQFYMKFLFLFILLIIGVLGIIIFSKDLVLTIASLLEDKLLFQINFWIIVNWIELMMLFTGNYLLYSYPIFHFVKIEYFIFTCLWFGFNYVITFFDLFKKGDDKNNDSDTVLWIVFCFQYCIFILIGVVPYLLTKFPQVNFAYFYTQGLSDNLFLFLSNEKCYKLFLEFLKGSEKEVMYLQLYTHVMNFKLECDSNEKNGENKCQLLNRIVELYFNDDGINYLKTIDTELWAIGQNVKSKFSGSLDLNTKQECLDEVLKYVFEQLLGLFNEFKTTVDFCSLIDYLKLNSFIQCKMINVGLLNKH